MCAMINPIVATCKYCSTQRNDCYKLSPCNHLWCEECLVVNYEDQGQFVCNPNNGSAPKCETRITADFLATLSISSERSEKFDDILNEAYWKKYRAQNCPFVSKFNCFSD
jgi:hypothetical protein